MSLFKRKTPKERIELGLARLIERDFKHDVRGLSLLDVQTELDFERDVVFFTVHGALTRQAVIEKSKKPPVSRS